MVMVAKHYNGRERVMLFYYIVVLVFIIVLLDD